jgi:hypothetical protein
VEAKEVGGYTKPLVSDCCSKGALSLHYCSSLAYLLVYNVNDIARRNVIAKYDCINRNWWRIPI